MTHTIEQATPRDVVTLAVYAEAIIRETGMGALAPYDAGSIGTTLKAMQSDDESTILVIRCHEVVGVLGGALEESYWNFAERIALHMFWWIHPEHRGAGLGQRLVEAFEAWARDKGASSVVFSVPVGGSAQRVLGDYSPLETRLIRRL